MESVTDTATCKSCAGAIPANARYCPSCGARIAEKEIKKKDEEGEHRQITVMFCDLVGSTKLSTQLHSEDLREVLRVFQSVCAGATESRGGMVAKYMGDGVMAYFGYPRAIEDAAIAATDAGLEIVEKIAELGRAYKADGNIEFASRVALHTGRVLISEMGAGETRDYHAVTGVVPNIAARLEQFAPVNGVVVSPQTRALIAGTFRIEPLGNHELKGISGGLEIFNIVGYAPATSILPERDTPIVGRESELAILHEAWVRARDHESTRVVVVADPGAGKSVLAASFIAQADFPRKRVVEIQGSAPDRHTPFACLRQTIGRWLELAGANDDLARRQWMRGWFGTERSDAQIHADALWDLWKGKNTDGAEGRAAIFDASVGLVESWPHTAFIVVDDAHWVDPSTMEMLDRISAATGVRSLVLVLTRPDLDEKWKHPAAITIELSRLNPEACNRLVEGIAGVKVEAVLARRIQEATDGLPLYIEEFTKLLIASDAVQVQRGVLRSVKLNPQAATPASLLDLITARLDKLNSGKIFAQISAVLGRSFERAALISVSGEAVDDVDTAIAALSVAGILTVSRGGRLSFRHALFQTAAYESIVRNTRYSWHKKYLSWLESDPDRYAATPPETVGHHLESCGRYLEAFDNFLEAGLAANRASASLEAAAHFQRCCDLLPTWPSEDELRVLKLRAQVLLAGGLLSARGPGAPETRAAYNVALGLAERTPECEWHFPAYWGWWRVSDSFATMANRARRLLQVSDQMQGKEFKLQAKHCVWANAFQTGALDESIENALDGLTLYESGGFEDLGTLYGGHDCKVCAHGEIGLARWLKGAGDTAVDHVEAALIHAGNLGHLGSLMHALDIAVMLHHYRRDGPATAETAQRLRDLGTQNDLEEYRAKGEIFLGWEQMLRGEIAEGLARINGGYRITQEIGTPEDFPVYQCMRSEALRLLGDPDAALAVLAEGRAIIAVEGVNYWGAEIARQEAEAEMSRASPDADFVSTRLSEAGQVARQQGALALELRAALSGLNWARMIGDEAAARADLSTVIDRFEMSATGYDIDKARSLLRSKSPDGASRDGAP